MEDVNRLLVEIAKLTKNEEVSAAQNTMEVVGQQYLGSGSVGPLRMVAFDQN